MEKWVLLEESVRLDVAVWLCLLIGIGWVHLMEEHALCIYTQGRVPTCKHVVGTHTIIII